MSVFPTPIFVGHINGFGVTAASPVGKGFVYGVFCRFVVPTGAAGGCGGDALQYIHEMR
jgi:hypothetical protein